MANMVESKLNGRMSTTQDLAILNRVTNYLLEQHQLVSPIVQTIR